MPETVKNIAELVVKYLKKELNEEEQNALIDWVNQSDDNRATFEKLTNADSLDTAVHELVAAREKVWEQFNALAPGYANGSPPASATLISRKRLIIAVVVLVLLLATVYLIFRQKNTTAENRNQHHDTKNLRPAH